MSQARKAALQFLDTEWRRRVWRQWLSNIFLPPVEPPMPSQPPPERERSGVGFDAPAAPVVPAVLVSESEIRVEAAAGAACVNGDGSPARSPVNGDGSAARSPVNGDGSAARAPVNGEGTDGAERARGDRDRAESDAPSARRAELRARFEALSDRLIGVEDAMDTLLRRSALRDKSERHRESRTAELIENIAEAAERQATVLEGLLGSVQRLEQSFLRLEREVFDPRRRDTYAPAAVTRSSPSRRPPPPERHESGAVPLRPYADDDGGDATPGSSMHGSLSEMSLSTVLAMLELERRTGRLTVVADDGALASFELGDGQVVGSRLADADADAVRTLRDALRWRSGRFWFRQFNAPETSSGPRSIGSLLLEATRQNDEAIADAAQA